MSLYIVRELDIEAAHVWKAVTEEIIREEVVAITNIDASLVRVEIDDVQMSSRRLHQSSIAKVARGGGNLRYLKEGSPLQIVFVTNVRLPSESDDWDITLMVGSALNTMKKRQRYIDTLKKSDSHFDELETVSLFVGDNMATGAEGPMKAIGIKGTAPDAETHRSRKQWYVIAAVAGGAGVLLLGIVIGMYYSMRNRMGESEEMHATSQGENAIAEGAAIANDQAGKCLEIVGKHDDRDDDISALEDPKFVEGSNAMIMSGDNTVGASLVSDQQQMYVYGVKNPETDITMNSSRAGTSTLAPTIELANDAFEDTYQPDRKSVV